MNTQMLLVGIVLQLTIISLVLAGVAAHMPALDFGGTAIICLTVGAGTLVLAGILGQRSND